MTGIEQRLREALTAEADARAVDVLALRGDLEERLARPRRRSRLLPAAAAAVLLVGGGLVAVQVIGADAPDSASSGEVDNEFSCPYTEHLDVVRTPGGFLPDLTDRTPAEVAREYDAPNWEFVVDGDTARLRLGNADGTLGSETRYQRQGDDWKLLTAEACSNGTTADPDADTLRLGTHGFEPHPPPEFVADGQPLLVDDRPIYAESGLVTDHRSLYVAPCDGDLCFATSSQDAVGDRMSITRGMEILGTMCWFFVPDGTVGRSSPYALLVAWDPTGFMAGNFRVAGPGGTYEGRPFEWSGGTAWLALVPTPPRDVKLLARLSHRGFGGKPVVWHQPVGCDLY